MKARNRHPIFDSFKAYVGPADPSFTVGFLGDVLRDEIEMEDTDRSAVRRPSEPVVNEEYFEWIDLLSAVKEAGPVFTMLELGAGYGRWSARAAMAARQLGKRIILGMAEAEPKHVQWLHRHMADNDISDYKVYEAALDGEAGEAQFAIGLPEVGTNYEKWFGQALENYDPSHCRLSGETYYGYPIHQVSNGWQLIYIQRLKLSDLIAHYDFVDFIDMDIQGAEGRSVREAIDALNQKVRRLHIGTHNHAVEVELRECLSSAGWSLGYDFPCSQDNDTEFGRCSFTDGVQSWLNPRLSPSAAP